MNLNLTKCREELAELEASYSALEAELEKAVENHIVDWIAIPGTIIDIPTKMFWPEPDGSPLWVLTDTGTRLSRFVGLNGVLQDNVKGFVVGTWHFGDVYAWATMTIPHAPEWINNLVI